MIVRSILPLLLVALVVLAGCRKPGITTYRIPKENDPATGGLTADSASSSGLTWTAPDHWKPKAASAMRKGSYAIAGENGAEADMSITAFPDDVGGELANVNRWRGQIQLPPVAEADLPSVVVRHDHNGLKFGEVDLLGSGENPQRILGAWAAFGGDTWFFKLMGPDAVVAREKAAFSAFIDSIKPGAAPSRP